MRTPRRSGRYGGIAISQKPEGGESARRFAADVDLAAVEPRGDLTSTGYALAWPGHQYVVLRPAGSDPSITVTLEPGTYTARWFDVDHGHGQDAGPVHADRSTTVTVRSPFDAETSSVIHLASSATASEQG
jgi:hypothetical protein